MFTGVRYKRVAMFTHWTSKVNKRILCIPDKEQEKNSTKQKKIITSIHIRTPQQTHLLVRDKTSKILDTKRYAIEIWVIYQTI